MRIITLVILFTVSFSVSAQISPPGMDNARVVGWGAIGFSQPFSKKWSVSVYTGGSLQSDPDNYNPLRKVGIFVANQETMYTINPKWQVVLANSIRIQDIYKEETPYDLEDPGVRNELRYYLRLFYKKQSRRATFTYSFRPEYRTFYTSDWDQWSTPLELRFRLKAQAGIPLNKSGSNQLILANELLSAYDHYQISKEHPQSWSKFHLTEDRLTNYFRHTFSKPSMIVDAGLMHQFWKDKHNNHIHYTLYVSVDLIFQHPFGNPVSKKDS